MTDSKPEREHHLFATYLPTAVTTLYLLAVWMLSYRQLTALETIHDSKGADLPVLFALIKTIGMGAPFYISIISIAIFLLIYFVHEVGLFVSAVWLACAFWLSWELISIHSSAWAAMSPTGFPTGLF